MPISDVVMMVISCLLILSVLISIARGLKNKEEKTIATMARAFTFIMAFAVFFTIFQGLNYLGLFENLPTFKPFYILSMLSLLYYLAGCFNSPKK